MTHDRERSKTKKQAIAREASAIVSSTDWKKTGDQFRSLLEEWKSAGHAGPDEERLWREFQSARNKFFDRRKAHFDKLNREREAAKHAKEQHVRDAQRLAESSDWKGAGDGFRRLMDRCEQVDKERRQRLHDAGFRVNQQLDTLRVAISRVESARARARATYVHSGPRAAEIVRSINHRVADMDRKLDDMRRHATT